jgi:hypothetical protein
MSADYCKELPFFDLSHRAFLKVTGAWLDSSLHSLLKTNDLFKDIIKSPENNFDQKNVLENYIESKYYSVEKTGTLIDRSRNKNGFSILHCNMRSLQKDILLFEELLCSLKETPKIIAVSETK